MKRETSGVLGQVFFSLPLPLPLPLPKDLNFNGVKLLFLFLVVSCCFLDNMASKQKEEDDLVKLKVGAVNNIAVGFARQMMKVWGEKKRERKEKRKGERDGEKIGKK